MKKLIFTLATLASLSTFAQQSFESPKKFGQSVNVPEKSKSTARSKFDVSDWYNTMDMMGVSNVGASLARFVNFLYHDSLAVFVNDDGTRDNAGAVSVGQILDPKDDLIDQTQNPGIKLTKYVSYKVDSIRFTYLYGRNADSTDNYDGNGKVGVVDTLFVAFYRGAQITKDPFQAGASKRHARVPFTTGAVRMPSGYLKLDTILLGPGTTDTTAVLNNNGGFENSWRSKLMTLPAPAGMSINAQGGTNSANLVGATITFKSGVKTVVNINGTSDTAIMVYQLDPSTIPANARRTNYFGYQTFNNEGTTEIVQPFYTNALISYPNQAYPIPGQTAGYVPGHLFNVEQFIDFDFLLSTTSGNVGMKEAGDAFGMTNIYPNPATVNSEAVMGFSLKSAANVDITIFNIAGVKVKTVINKAYTAGEYEESFNLNGMKAGIYFVNMTVNGNSITKKLTITE